MMVFGRWQDAMRRPVQESRQQLAWTDCLWTSANTGWDKKPNVRIVFGRWQDVLPQLGTYDGIFFDTFGEYYDDLRWECSVKKVLISPHYLMQLGTAVVQSRTAAPGESRQVTRTNQHLPIAILLNPNPIAMCRQAL